MIDRFDDADLRARLRPEFVEQANPERAWTDAVISDDIQLNTQSSMTVLYMTLAEHHVGFIPTEEQYDQLRVCDDELEEHGQGRIWTFARHDDESPSGMD